MSEEMPNYYERVKKQNRENKWSEKIAEWTIAEAEKKLRKTKRKILLLETVVDDLKTYETIWKADTTDRIGIPPSIRNKITFLYIFHTCYKPVGILYIITAMLGWKFLPLVVFLTLSAFGIVFFGFGWRLKSNKSGLL